MKKRLAIGLAAALGLALLAGAAYVAVNWAAPSGSAFNKLQLPGAAGTPSNKKGGGVSIEVELAPGIPVTNPDLVGALVEKQDNSLMTRAQTKGGGEAPLTEVVVTGDTRLYRNATGDRLDRAAPLGHKDPDEGRGLDGGAA